MNEGEYLIFGFLSFSGFKQRLVSTIKGYQNRFLSSIPARGKQVRQQLVRDLQAHL